MIKVVHVTVSMGVGGLENLVLSLARAMQADSMAVCIYCLDHGGELLDIAAQHGIAYRIFNRRPGFDWRLIFKLAYQLRSDKPQVVHTHNQAAHFYGCLAAVLAGIPLRINTEHSRHLIDQKLIRRAEKWFLARLTRVMVTVSAELRDLSIRKDFIPASKLRVIDNGIDLAKFDSVTTSAIAEFRRSVNALVNDRLIAIVARLHPVKNHSLLLEAFQQVLLRRSDVRLLIVGDGEQRSYLIDRAASLAITQRAHFLGNRMDIPVIMRAADVVVLCSVTEGAPMVLLEAMAANVPILITKNANRSRLVKHGCNGIVSTDTPHAIADALDTLLNSMELRQKIVGMARREVQDRFALANVVERYRTIYAQAGS